MYEVCSLLHSASRKSETIALSRRAVALAIALVATIIPQSAVQGATAPAPLHSNLPWARLGKLVPLDGTMSPILGSAKRLIPLNAARPITVGLTFGVRDDAGLQQFLRDVYNPRSSLFHHFLTPELFAARFAPTPQTRATVTRWLVGKGLTITRRFRNGMEIEAQGPTGRVASAFGTRLYNYRQGSLRFYANTEPVQVPQGLASSIATVVGLNSAPVARHHLSRPRRLSHHNGSPNGFWPQEVASVYDLQSLYDSGWNGSGQTVALVEFAGYSEADIATYDSQFAISPGPLQRIQVGEGASLGDGQNECELDIEMVHAVAPAATTLVYEAPNGQLGDVSIWNQIVSDNRAQVISTSWGQSEQREPLGVERATNLVLEEAAAQGQGTYAASGDGGAYDVSGGKKQLAVDFPASDPWVTGAGGTSLHVHADGAYGSESAWSQRNGDHGPAGSGGGLSTVFPRPSYQSGLGVLNRYSNGMRQVPDVSANADPNTGYAIYTVDKDNSPGWVQVGGTSAAAPLWGSFMLLVNESIGQRTGFMNPTFYALERATAAFPSKPFHDITNGDNLYYLATTGWDFATGWGSFDASALLTDLRSTGGPLPVQLPAVDFYLDAAVAIKSGTRYIEVKQIKRGQTAYLLTYVTLQRLAGDGSANRRILFGLPGRTIYRKTVSDHFTASQSGQTIQKASPFHIPRTAGRGTYTLAIQEALLGVTERASSTVRIR